MTSEGDVKHAIRVALGKLGWVSIYNNPVGVGFTKDGDRITYGLSVGSPDLVGFIRGSGKFLGIEVKTTSGRASDDQKKWLKYASESGCVVGICRSPEEALALVAPHAPPGCSVPVHDPGVRTPSRKPTSPRVRK